MTDNSLMASPQSETDLTLSGADFLTFSARNCHQDLVVLPQGEFHRTLHGDLQFLGEAQAYKFRSVIRCQDRNLPAFRGLRPGMQITAGCIATLTQPVTMDASSTQLERQPVPGSVMGWHDAGPLEITVQGRTITLNPDNSQSQPKISRGFVSYRPQLEMLVTSCRFIVDEWNVQTAWELELEEI